MYAVSNYNFSTKLVQNTYLRFPLRAFPTTSVSSSHYLTGTFLLHYRYRIPAVISTSMESLNSSTDINTLLSCPGNILCLSSSTITIYSCYILRFILPDLPFWHSTSLSILCNFKLQSRKYTEDIQDEEYVGLPDFFVSLMDRKRIPTNTTQHQYSRNDCYPPSYLPIPGYTIYQIHRQNF